MKTTRIKWLMFFVVALVFVAVSALVSVETTAPQLENASNTILVQSDPDIELLPQGLERLSWTSIIAGSLMTLILMFILNLFGIAIGLTQVNPEYGQDSADASGIATGGLIWVAVSNLIALFVGGWLAAYFAGIPEGLDGFLHGLMVWAVSGLVTVAFVMSGLGRMMSGIAGLLSSGLSITSSLTSGASQVAGSALSGAGSVASSATSTAGNLGAQTLSILANGVQSSAQVMGSGMSSLSSTAIENTPDVQDALNYQDLSYSEIKHQLSEVLRQAGRDPNKIEESIEQTVNDVANATKYAMRNPENAPDMLEIVLRRVLRRGENVANDVDRQALRNYITANSDLSEEDAEAQVQQIEEQFAQVKEQTKQAREIAKQRAEEFRQEAETKAQELYQTAQDRVTEMQQEAEARLKEASEEAEKQAREVAQQASDSFAKLAAGIAVALVIGAVAAGLGGFFGAPETLPDVPITEASNVTPHYSSLSVDKF